MNEAPQLAGQGASEERLAAPRRPVQQQAAAHVGTERLAQLRRAQRAEEAQLQLALDRLEAGDVAQLDAAGSSASTSSRNWSYSSGSPLGGLCTFGGRRRAAERTGERGVGRGQRLVAGLQRRLVRRLEGGDVVRASGDDDADVIERLGAAARFDEHLSEVAAEVEVVGSILHGPLEGPDHRLRGHEPALYRCASRATLGP